MILIVVEHANGKVSKSTWEMVTAARELGREAPITALVSMPCRIRVPKRDSRAYASFV